MNSPQKDVATDMEQLNELLDIILEGYSPCDHAAQSDREVTSPELQITLMAHSGLEFSLAEINKSLKERGYKLRAGADMELAWMLVRK